MPLPVETPFYGPNFMSTALGSLFCSPIGSMPLSKDLLSVRSLSLRGPVTLILVLGSVQLQV